MHLWEAEGGLFGPSSGSVFSIVLVMCSLSCTREGLQWWAMGGEYRRTNRGCWRMAGSPSPGQHLGLCPHSCG